MAGGESRHWVHNELISPTKEKCKDYEDISSRTKRDAHNSTEYYRGGFDEVICEHRPYILESFFYTDKDTERLLPFFGDFLLDSGAFTFIQNSGTVIDWEEYLERYANFINRNNIDKFFELDIDKIVGYEKVIEFRKNLEKLTNKQCIPVWHRNRGYDEYIKHCEEYPYIAIGGIAIKEIKRNEYPIFHKLLQEAHKRKCKVHGLGFTQLKLLTEYRFDSVDSTAWTTGNRFGYLYMFNGKTMQKIDRPEGKKLANPREAALFNYTEWLKFQKYADEFL